MIVEIYTKNMALKKKLELDTVFIPRIGETLFFDIDGKENASSHLVHDVVYYVSGQNLTPVVSCHEAIPNTHRKIILEEHGWL